MRRPTASHALCLIALAASLPSATRAQVQDQQLGDDQAGAQDENDERLPVTAYLPDNTPSDIVEAAMAGTPVGALPDALRRAYWTTPSLLAQRSGTHSADYGVAAARAGYGPKLDYQMTYGYQKDIYELSQRPGHYFVAGAGWSSTASAILTQPLFTFGRNFAQERYAVAQAAYQQQVLRSTEQQALLNAINAYVALQRDRMGVGIALDNLDTLERELADNRARFKQREVTSTDVQQVETRVELGRVQVLAAERDAASSEATFLRMIGARATETLAAPNPLQLPVRTLEEAYAYSEAHNPILLAAQERERVSRASLSAARSDLMPRVDLNSSANLLSQSPYRDGIRQIDLRATITISGPIYESGLRRARIDQALAANDSDWRLIDGALRDNRASLAAAWNDWQAQTAAIERLAAAVESARKAYDGALLQERAGMRTTLDVIDLAREMLTARSNYNSAMAAAYIGKAQVLAAMGALEQSWLLPDAARDDAQGRARRAQNNGDTPFVTESLRAIDGISKGSFHERPMRDPAARTTTPAVKLSLPEPLPAP